MSQYALSLSLPPVFAPDNFFVAGSNRDAHGAVTAWPDWPSHALLLHGPHGSGKSHLSHIWAESAQARVLMASELAGAPPQGNALVEDIDALRDEKALLHMFNAAKENNAFLLLTSLLPASQLKLALPDLASRLRAIPAVSIHEADDEALAGVLRKQFADRQVKVDEEVIEWLVTRMERSLAKVSELTEQLDRASLVQGRRLTIPFVRGILG